MKLKRLHILLVTLISLAITSCEKQDDISIPVKFESLTTDNGTAGGTSKLILIFNGTIEGLTVDNIELTSGETGAQKGALNEVSTGTYELELLQVKTSGEVSIKVACNGYSITPSQKTVAIGFEAGIITNKPFITAVEKSAKVTFTKNADGNVVVADNQTLINSIKTLNISNRDLTSIEGIEYFTNLKQLNCPLNQITKLDLSKNTLLEKLNCNNNNKITKFDVSKNTLLKILSCEMNQLTALDLSKNTMLEQLQCSLNKLTELDLSKNTLIEQLDCGSNQLTALDLSNNTMLEKLICHGNQFTELELSQNTLLEQLECAYNQLTKLDLSQNTLLQRLLCSANQLTELELSKNTQLEILNCGQNQLTALDLSKNTLLEELYCSNNQLTALELSKNTLLELLYCLDNKLTKLDLSNNTLLELLYCLDNKLTKLDITKLSKFEPTSQFSLLQTFTAATLELSVTTEQKALIDADQTSWAANNKVTVVVAP